MNALLDIVRLMITAHRRALLRGAALAVTVLIMGAALLGLSGWFITAAGLAGMAGVGSTFDVFRPSAGVRFLALGRTAARYGERLVTHDATLRALATLRVAVLRGFALGNGHDLLSLRKESVLTRIISDVDALEGVLLRLWLPVAAALVTHVLVFATLTWLVGWPVALMILIGYLCLGAATVFSLARRSFPHSGRAEDQSQRLRRGVIDMIRDREALILTGTLPAQENTLLQIDDHARDAARQLDKAERAAAVQMQLAVALISAGALLAGAVLFEQGAVTAPVAVIGFFVALALAETLLALRRGFADLGRMVLAAKRVAPKTKPLTQPLTPPQTTPDQKPRPQNQTQNQTRGTGLLSVNQPGLTLDLGPGQTVALTGPSGVGKSTLLMQIAGLIAADGIRIHGQPPSAWPEDELRDIIALLPQRSALMAGTIRDNLSLSAPYSDDDLWRVLNHTALADTIAQRGGLDAQLREGGAGLSGGQRSRLCLARVLLQGCNILLLDEPTEGLDPETARAVLDGVRCAAPDALIVIATHQQADHAIFDQLIHLSAE